MEETDDCFLFADSAVPLRKRSVIALAMPFAKNEVVFCLVDRYYGTELMTFYLLKRITKRNK